MAHSFKGIFAGGSLYLQRNASINDLKNSGFNTLIIGSLYVSASGDLNLNMEFPLIRNGFYSGRTAYPHFAGDLSSLKKEDSSITRLEISIGSADPSTFENIRMLTGARGVDPESGLYRNFKTLKDTLPQIDAINLYDQTTYDADSSIKFAIMLGSLGYKVTLCPYTLAGYWTALASHVNHEIPGTVDAVYLQCYDGGRGNTPCQGWKFHELPVYPGLRCKNGDGCSENDSPENVFEQFSWWKDECHTTGGWMWQYDDMLKCTNAALYAEALEKAFG